MYTFGGNPEVQFVKSLSLMQLIIRASELYQPETKGCHLQKAMSVCHVFLAIASITMKLAQRVDHSIISLPLYRPRVCLFVSSLHMSCLSFAAFLMCVSVDVGKKLLFSAFGSRSRSLLSMSERSFHFSSALLFSHLSPTHFLLSS